MKREKDREREEERKTESGENVGNRRTVELSRVLWRRKEGNNMGWKFEYAASTHMTFEYRWSMQATGRKGWTRFEPKKLLSENITPQPFVLHISFEMH